MAWCEYMTSSYGNSQQFKDIVKYTQTSKSIKCNFFSPWVQNFVSNFKVTLWNFTQNYDNLDLWYVNRPELVWTTRMYTVHSQIKQAPISHRKLPEATLKQVLKTDLKPYRVLKWTQSNKPTIQPEPTRNQHYPVTMRLRHLKTMQLIISCFTPSPAATFVI